MTRSLVALALLVTASSVRADLAIYRSGNGDDVRPALHGPVLDLAGSSAEETALQAMVDAVRGCRDCDTKLDVVVLRGSGAEGLNEPFMRLRGVDSAVTFVITDRDSANRRDVAAAVAHAEIVWFAGGDQCHYIRWVKGTRVHRAVERVYARRGGIGGNSAGLAIQGEVAYDACPDVSAKSEDVLRDPFSRDVSLSSHFLRWPALRGIITDTHFTQRSRMGRLLVFLARSAPMAGLGIDEKTSVVVTPDRKGRVYGPGAAYYIVADHAAEVLERGKPLTYRGYKVWKFDSGSTIDFTNRPQDGYRTVDVVEGAMR